MWSKMAKYVVKKAKYAKYDENTLAKNPKYSKFTEKWPKYVV